MIHAPVTATPPTPVRKGILALLPLLASAVAAAAQQPGVGRVASAPGLPATVIIDASDFLHEIQKGHVVTDAAGLRVPWVFNNTALQMGSRSNYVVRVSIPEAGIYHLYVRSQGGEGAGFRVAVGDRPIDSDVGDGPMAFERTGSFELAAGAVDVRLMRIEGGPVLDVLVLSKGAELREEDLVPLQLHPDVELVREYRIPASNAVKFGDLTGDGRTDFVVLTPGYGAHAFDHEGRPLWQWEAPEEGQRLRAEFEAPGAVWDLDQDGRAELIHWRQVGQSEWLVVADGRTGEVKRQVRWPTRPLPHVYNNFRIAIGRLEPGYPQAIVLLTDSGDTISVAAYDGELRQLWNHLEIKKKDHLGHYLYPVDLDRDGVDEVVVGDMVLNARGERVWDRFDLFYDHHDHPDSFRFVDLDGDGKLEIVSSHSEVGVVAYEGLTGRIRWQHTAEHTQQIEPGHFLDGVPGPQVAAGARTYGNRQAGEPYLSGQVWWFDREGTLLSKWPGMPLNGNPVFVKGDWKGDGREELFWYKFRMRGDGRGELYFGQPVFHMFDFLGDRAEEVITLERGVLRVYGFRGASHEGAPVAKTPDYLRSRVTNHTHY